MRYISRGITRLLKPIVMNHLNEPRQGEEGKVYLPKFFLIFGTIFFSIVFILFIIIICSDEPLWAPIFLIPLLSLGLFFIIAFVNCRIYYNEEGFVAKNFFGIKRKFTYDQVTAIDDHVHEMFIYAGERRVAVDGFSIGGIEFIDFVKQKYQSIHDGQSLPKTHKAKRDIFNGHISDKAGFVFIYILVGVLGIGVLVISIYFTYFMQSSVDNTTKQSVSFVSCDKMKDEVILISTDNQIYKIHFTDEQFDVEDIQSLCDGEKIVTTYSTLNEPDDGENYYSLKAIKYNDKYFLSFEETNKLHRGEYMPGIFVGLAMCLIWGAYVLCSIIVGRNPQKFNKRIVRIFFQEEYVRY